MSLCYSVAWVVGVAPATAEYAARVGGGKGRQVVESGERRGCQRSEPAGGASCRALLLGGILVWLLLGCWRPLLGSTAVSAPEPGDVGGPGWYEANSPIVREYLTTLPDRAVGTELRGITLSDGNRWFEGDEYLGWPVGLPSQVSGRAIRTPDGTRVYLWVEEGGEPFALGACGGETDRGIRARRWAGEIHTWKNLRSEHGIVYTPCPPDEWIPAGRPRP